MESRTTPSRKLINAIYDRERAAAERVRWPSDEPERRDRKARERVLRSLFRTEVDTIRTFARWATCPAGVPTVRMVLRHQPLLVNVEPMPLDTFERLHGMAPSAMAELVREGWIIVNLHAFENDRDREFADHERYASVLGPLLRLESGCRIMYARRDRYFELLGVARQQREEAEEEGRGIFAGVLKLVSPSTRREHISASSGVITDALNKVAENWSYLVVLAANDRGDARLGSWLADVRESLRKYAKSTPPTSRADRDGVLHLLQELNAWKHLHASVEIKAFGGTLILSTEDFWRAQAWRGPVDVPKTPPSSRDRPRSRRARPLTAHQILTLGDAVADHRERLESLHDRWSADGGQSTRAELRDAHRQFGEAERAAFADIGEKGLPRIAEPRVMPATKAPIGEGKGVSRPVDQRSADAVAEPPAGSDIRGAITESEQAP